MPKRKFKLPRVHNTLNINDLRKKAKRLNKEKIIELLPKIGLGALGFVILLFAWYSKDLPTPNGIRHHLEEEETTKIFDRTGQHLLYAISGTQRRISIPLSEMPDSIKQAVIATEDKNFYHHKGLDFRGIARAIYYDITRRTNAYGGSTITQQLAKNAIIQSNKKRFDRKIREVVLSIEIEAMFPKDKILELYLNEIPFGGQAYGVEAASETYFGKKAKDLSLEEVATLAAMIQRPSYYSPYGSHLEELVARRNFVLSRMVKENFITGQQAEETQAKKLVVVPRRDTILAPHFVMYVRDIVAEKYGEDIFSSGLTITTTLDVEQQKAAEQAVADGAARNKEKYNIDNAGLVAVNPKTGEVLAMVGSADYFNSEINGQFNVTTALRQPGSAFKPLVYATALKQKYNPAFLLYDLPTSFGSYKPSNFDGRYRGPVTMREALGQSLNIPAVKTLALVGVREALKTAASLGITTLNQPDRYGLSLVLGAGEVKPIELASAYGVFFNGGVRQETVPVLKVEDKKGRVLEEFRSEDHKKDVLDPAVAYEISDMLSDQVAKAPVFGNLLSFGGRTVASKTGTTNGVTGGSADVRDAWAVGGMPSISVAIWTGNNDHSPLGKGVLAANAAVPIFKQYMNSVLPSLPNENFHRPSSIQTIAVDKFSNRLPSDATPPEGIISDIFASWQVPSERDNVHVKVKLCKGTDLLATDETPPEEIEERYYVSIHSEKPNDPDWEGPVQAWADQNGFTNRPPTAKCDKFTAENRPQLFFNKPTNGESVTANFEIEVGAGAQYGVSEVTFSIDGDTIGRSVAAPYRTSYNASSLSSGPHTLTAEAKDPFGRSNKVSITINVTKESTPPGPVSGVILIPKSGQVQITWTNPSDPDLAKLRFYISDTPGSLGLRYATEVVASPGTTTTYTLSGLASGKTYYFTLKPVDNNDNENQSTTQYSTTAL